MSAWKNMRILNRAELDHLREVEREELRSSTLKIKSAISTSNFFEASMDEKRRFDALILRYVDVLQSFEALKDKSSKDIEEFSKYTREFVELNTQICQARSKINIQEEDISLKEMFLKNINKQIEAQEKVIVKLHNSQPNL